MSEPASESKGNRNEGSPRAANSRFASSLVRLVTATAGGVAATPIAAVLEGRYVGSGHLLPVIAVLAPIGLVVGAAVGVAHLVLEGDPPEFPWEHAARRRAASSWERSRRVPLAAATPIAAVLAATAWAYAARAIFAGVGTEPAPNPLAVGAALALTSLLILAVAAAVVLALVVPLRRFFAAIAEKTATRLDPGWVFLASSGTAVFVVARGIHGGDGNGEGTAFASIFGVLARPELDLVPVGHLALLALGAWLATLFGRGAFAPRVGAGALLPPAAIVAGLVCTAQQGPRVDATTSLSIEQHGKLAAVAQKAVRKLVDRDHDGASPWFGGGDCDDRDRRRNPNALDIPGNGIDEDCSGADLTLVEEAPAAAKAPAAVSPIRGDYNLVLLTVDTMRADQHFAGYAKETTPELDKLAAQSVVFDRAYAMASYTGKSVGPIMAGKYPSETPRDGGHFTAYPPENVFLAERLKMAGFRTFGAASLGYIGPGSGITQGFDTWDLSAKPPPSGSDEDDATTSDKLADAALKLLAKPENVEGRFFLWVHFLDPHAMYVHHKGQPDFAVGAKTGAEQVRAAYDGEVWFTDSQIGRILDYIQAQKYAKETVIVVSSDHGEAFGDHGMSFHGFEIWESLARVPLIIHVPGVTPHHVPNKRSQIDLVPTILDLLRIAPPPQGELSGRSLMDDLFPSEPGKFAERDVYIDMPIGPYTGMRRALIHGDGPGMKLIHSGGNLYQLFDLATDPEEKLDLSKDKEKLAPMIEAMQRKRATMHELDVKPRAAN